MNIISQLKKFIKLLSKYFYGFLLSSCYEHSYQCGKTWLHDNRQKSDRGQACQAYFLRISRHTFLFEWVYTQNQVIQVSGLRDANYINTLMELFGPNYTTKKGSRASALPIYWSWHTQAQTGRGVWFRTIQNTGWWVLQILPQLLLWPT